MKVLTVIGTRPEAIKMAPVIRELQRRRAEVSSVVCVTGQHRQMLDQVLNLFGVVPHYDLNLMEENQTLGQIAAGVLFGLGPILKTEKPDWVLVQGDTTTAAAAALCAFYSRIQVGHVEAGLRTYDKWQPFPEEINRRVASVIADLHFAPTEQSRDNLEREGIPARQIMVTGNTVIDSLQWAAEQPATPMIDGMIRTLNLEHCRMVLVTAHRRENFGVALENICLALRDIVVRYEGQVRVVYPVHLNPQVQEPVYRILGQVPQVTLLDPVDYLTLVHLIKCAYLVLTDSGGIQEEAPSLGKPVLVLREITERPEAVEAGTVRVVGTDRNRVVEEASRLLDDDREYHQMAQAANPYGDGHASRRIVSGLLGEPADVFRPARSGP